jgi:hypothetical protein
VCACAPSGALCTEDSFCCSGTCKDDTCQ